MKKTPWTDFLTGHNTKPQIQNRKWAVLLTIIALLAGYVETAEAQQAKNVPRIGYLSRKAEHNVEAFRQGLRELGYIEGENIVVEYRWAEGQTKRIQDLTTELVRLKVDLIVTGNTLAVQAARKLTTTIPIVIVGVGDPVGTGLVASLARPGGNVTGLSGLAPELSAKRLELLKEAFPKVSRIAVFWNPASPSNVMNWKETEAAARPAAVKLQSLEVRSPDDFDGAFRAAVKERVHALIAIRDNVINNRIQQIVAFAAKNRLPGMYPVREYVENGGLMSYDPDFLDIFKRAAIYVDKILKGAKPGELPVEQPTKFELVINLKTARSLGLTIPQSILMRADRVIK